MMSEVRELVTVKKKQTKTLRTEPAAEIKFSLVYFRNKVVIISSIGFY